MQEFNQRIKPVQTYIFECTVKSDLVIDGHIKVLLHHPHFASDEWVDVKILVPDGNAFKPPEKNSTGLVLVTTNGPVDQNSQMYYIGRIVNKFSEEDQKNTAADDIKQTISKDKNTRSYVVDDNAGMISGDNKIAIGNKEGLHIQADGNVINLSKEKLSITVNSPAGEANSNLILAQKQALLQTTGILTFRGNDVAIFTNGNIQFSGNKGTTGGDGVHGYEAMGKFLVKSSLVDINTTGGPFIVNSTNVSMKLTGGKLTGGGSGIPGTGPDAAFNVQALMGDIYLEGTVGDVSIGTLNPIGTTKVYGGSMISPMQSSLQLTGTGATLENLSPLPSKLQLGAAGNATLEATLDITLDALKNVNITSLLNTTIDSKVQVAIKTLTAEIEGTIMTKIKAAILDLKESKIIDAGPKLVAPTGSGPFCALPVCVITGAPHTGDKAMG